MKTNWQTKRLGEVCEEVFAGGDKPKNNFSKFKTDAFQVPIFSNGVKNDGLYGYTNIARVKKPSITISARGTIGYSLIRKEPFLPIIRLIVLLPKNNLIDLDFLHYSIKINTIFGNGTSIPQLTVPAVKKIKISFPPLPEQRRIVKILDEVFEDVKKAKENAEKNLANAKELFKSYLQEVFANVRDDWEEINFENSIEKVIYTNKIQRNRFLKSGKFPIISQEKDLINGHWNKKSDLFYVKTPVIVFGDHTKVLKYVDFNFVLGADGVKILKPKDFLYPKFFYYQLIGLDLKSLGYARHYRILKEKNILYPSLTTQKQIVTKLDALSASTKKLEKNYQQKIDDLEELKKSVLKKAFNGEL